MHLFLHLSPQASLFETGSQDPNHIDEENFLHPEDQDVLTMPNKS
jgi:hypothetical protein